MKVQRDVLDRITTYMAGVAGNPDGTVFLSAEEMRDIADKASVGYSIVQRRLCPILKRHGRLCVGGMSLLDLPEGVFTHDKPVWGLLINKALLLEELES